ncbi:Metallo-beta-lactamase domain-containing protein 2 [Oryzias melastigma]|uniref:Metallo-beta-lactamase domain-containing protein 2 n=1 Tax=Oryzias melastigma TaxID=30732 RepID=A0A834CHC1_ORYME|nr:Metallo-beta-lactamase domain-containing protein 2 [Oryzias melastigma]
MSAADWYAHKSLGDGLFWIQERFYQSDNRANIWLLRGSHQDVVIDTGLGLRSLPDYIDSKGLLGKDPQRKNPLLGHRHPRPLRPLWGSASVPTGGRPQRGGRCAGQRRQLRDGHLAERPGDS